MFTGPIGLPRACMEDLSISGKIIPKYSVIIPHFMSAHYDENYWENPTEFQPERFLTDDGKHIKHHKAFHPFSVGMYFMLWKQLLFYHIRDNNIQSTCEIRLFLSNSSACNMRRMRYYEISKIYKRIRLLNSNLCFTFVF